MDEKKEYKLFLGYKYVHVREQEYRPEAVWLLCGEPVRLKCVKVDYAVYSGDDMEEIGARLTTTVYVYIGEEEDASGWIEFRVGTSKVPGQIDDVVVGNSNFDRHRYVKTISLRHETELEKAELMEL